MWEVKGFRSSFLFESLSVTVFLTCKNPLEQKSCFVILLEESCDS